MYQPALLPRQIRGLYWVKQIYGRPMTHHARAAIDQYLAQFPEVADFLPSEEKDDESVRG